MGREVEVCTKEWSEEIMIRIFWLFYIEGMIYF